MRLRDRGMVKWAPYKSLPEQENYLAEMEYEREKVDMPILSEEELQELDVFFVHLKRGDSLTIEYYSDGYLLKARASFYSIDEIAKAILFFDHEPILISQIIACNQ